MGAWGKADRGWCCTKRSPRDHLGPGVRSKSQGKRPRSPRNMSHSDRRSPALPRCPLLPQTTGLETFARRGGLLGRPAHNGLGAWRVEVLHQPRLGPAFCHLFTQAGARSPGRRCCVSRSQPPSPCAPVPQRPQRRPKFARFARFRLASRRQVADMRKTWWSRRWKDTLVW